MEGTILSNEAGFVLDGNWELPDQNTTGIISNVDNFTFVLGIENDDHFMWYVFTTCARI